MIHNQSVRYYAKGFFCLLALLPLLCVAQVIVNVQLPPGGMVQKEQLWNLSLINNTADGLEAGIKMVIQDAQTGQELLSANSGRFIINKGIKLITSSELQPILYNNISPGLSGSFLPMGTFTACYQVYRIYGEEEEILANECIQFTIDPLSPPLLNTPADNSVVATGYPLFTWMPPAPAEMFSSLSYDIVVTAVQEGQPAIEAIQYNTPVYSNYNLSQPIENYPASFSALEPGKTYAWQVIAKNGLNYAAKTEVYRFMVDTLIPPVSTPVNNGYLLLDNNFKDTYIITNRKLLLKYISFDREYDGLVVFADTDGNVISSINKTIQQGDNYFDFSLGNEFKKEGIYTSIITDLSGKEQVLHFSIKK